MELKDVINKPELFRELGDDELTQVLGCARERSYADGEEIFGQNSTGDEMYVIREGTVAIRRMIHGEEGVEIARLAQGQLLAEQSFFDGSPRSAAAVAEGQVSVLVLGREEFFRVLELNPAMMSKILLGVIRTLSERLRETSYKLSLYRPVHHS
jgi:CRP-like cAMP-binding protein